MTDKSLGNLLDHEYDGIREYDNPTPAWWHLIFIGSVVFSAVYLVFFHFGSLGWTVPEAYQNAVANNLRLRFEEIGELAPDEPTILKYMQEPEWLNVGATVYTTNCKSCHGEKGEGLVGPNLTDDHYKNVKQLTDIARVLEEGAANGSMPAWRNRLHPNEIVLVAAYVANMRGENLPGPRAQEGESIPAWPQAPVEAPAADPTDPTDPTDRTDPADAGAAADADPSRES